ncbi:uncharacterized protein N7459_008914 [Penicillium hispanicum]|uniref:uncharacterized protein n=1 Tax=Penicillium hispanicum TaxID=1080232 RepID=UPI002541AD82|nr:uncharacterized protein N7459_008914 [Penicillium hispanicum]KAJ5569484.1 hypothetical protein N7459_008914 [Penicillium hispanicum]
MPIQPTPAPRRNTPVPLQSDTGDTFETLPWVEAMRRKASRAWDSWISVALTTLRYAKERPDQSESLDSFDASMRPIQM